MKTFFLIRFDRVPRRDVSQILIQFIEGETPQFISTPSTMITIFKSTTHYEDIYKALGALKPITAFFLIDVTGVDLAIHMPEDVTIPLMQFLGKSLINKAEYLPIDSMTLSELNRNLKDAISNENYELASQLRDRISNQNDSAE